MKAKNINEENYLKLQEELFSNRSRDKGSFSKVRFYQLGVKH